ncbi:Uncharacterised protein [uncultured archaeon]|nr:Uncharacterised protein [uncultured archaeon]
MNKNSNRVLSLDEIRRIYFNRPTTSFLIINDLRAVPGDMNDGLVNLLEKERFALVFDWDGSREYVRVYADGKKNAIWHSMMPSQKKQYYRCVFFGYGNHERVVRVMGNVESFMADLKLISGHRPLAIENGRAYSLSTQSAEERGL